MTRPPSPQSGVALIVTIIMLSVITFLTVAFLALSGREKGSVKVMTAQTTAQLGADYAIERAKVDLLTGILATRNPQVFDLLVSTNYINYAYGFQSGAGAADPTNVSYTYLNGNPLNQADLLQNLANQLYDPRPPVFITNRLAANSTEFRYYLDLNRNGQHDRSGLWPETNQLGLNIIGTNSLILSNRFVGDPEWIGIPARPGLPHSASNQYVARYAFVVVPEGKTLDVNYMHNQAATRTVGVLDSDGFFRNQGVGGWELNLAAFLADLNTNIWNNNPAAPTYQYNQVNPGSGIGPTGFGNVGLAFDDARSILNYRYANNYNNLIAGHPAFMTNLVDEYSDGNWMTFPFSIPLENDVTRPWAGSDNPNHFFSLQDLFSKVPGGFSARLINASSNLSTYDQYTYYRLLAQLGTASAPEDSGKLNLNYANVAGYSVTNYVPWTEVTGNAAEFFFTNAVDRLLRKYSEEWLASDRTVYTNLFRMERAFGVTNIPVMVSNQFVYSPAIHRLLQVAANIWDTKPNARKALGLPTVFRPQFEERDGNVYIVNFREETTATGVSSSTGNLPIYDPYGTTNLAALVQQNAGNVLLYGVPLVVGAHKGLPNFNEFQFETLFSITRKVQLRKQGGTITETNQYFTIEVQMPAAAEFWNSYATNFNRPVSIHVTNVTSMTMTNDLGVNFTTFFTTGDRHISNSWRAFNAFKNLGDDLSHAVLMRTNVPFLPERVYLPDRGALGFFSITNDTLFDTSQNLLMPRWGVVISNRVHAMIVDNQDRIMDYVVLGNLTFATNLTDMVNWRPTENDNPFKRAWQVNQLAGDFLTGRPGIIEQINISLDTAGNSSEWRSYSKSTPNDVDAAKRNFRNFYYTAETNGYATVPYTPTKQFRVPMIWQANDPLVHYLADDLYDTKSGVVAEPDPKPVMTALLAGIGNKNGRYQPWPKDVNATESDEYATDISIKDARVRASDDWQFPTNVLPTVGWLGRVHRGTPWQTVYMKAGNVGLTNIVFSPSEWAVNFEAAATRWANWSGNRTLQGGYYTRPTADRLLFDVFTTAVNDNSARGRLNINQTNLAAWSAVFSGVAALTNVSNTQPIYNPYVIEPAGIYDAQNPTTWPPLVRIVDGINAMRANTNYFRNGSFQSLGDILAVPELTDESPFLNRASDIGRVRALTDVAYEWLPQQVMSLLHLEEATRFSIFAYGQALQPAPDSILVGGAFSGLCTNYAITAEVAARAVLRVEGSPEPGHADYPPKVVVESFNYLPPE